MAASNYFIILAATLLPAMVNICSGKGCFIKARYGNLATEGDCESTESDSIFSELKQRVEKKGLRIQYCQCQCIGYLSYSPLLDLRAEKCRVPRHVKSSRFREASRKPRALSRVDNCQEANFRSAKIQNKTGGVLDINFPGIGKIELFCDNATDGGGWTVIQRRMDGSTDFYLGWNDYVNGFGRKQQEFWLGLESIYTILQNKTVELRIDMEDWNGVKKFAKYSHFSISSYSDDYALNISGYTGDAGDSLTWHNGMKFSTKDHDVDVETYHCAVQFQGAWWYRACHHSNLNGLYHRGNHTTHGDGINWRTWTGNYYSLKFVEMKIRPVV